MRAWTSSFPDGDPRPPSTARNPGEARPQQAVTHRRAADSSCLRGDVLLELLDLVLPLECGACRVPGTRWCPSCDAALAATGFPGGPRRAEPHPGPAGLPPTHAWGAYAGPLRPALTAWKDEGRTDLDLVLRPLLASAVRAAISASASAGEVCLLVSAPSSRRSRRRRGEIPLERLVSGIDRGEGVTSPVSVAGGGLAGAVARPVPGVLVQCRPVADQSGLGTTQRAANLQGALRVPPRFEPVVRGRRCVVVDDVVTTGATLSECARALLRADARQVTAATIAATERTAGAAAGVLL